MKNRTRKRMNKAVLGALVFLLIVFFFCLFSLECKAGPAGPAAIMHGTKIKDSKIYNKGYSYRGKVVRPIEGSNISVIYDQNYNRVGQIKDGVIYDKQWNRVGEVKYETSPAQ